MNSMKIVFCVAVCFSCVRTTLGGKHVSIADVCSFFIYLLTEKNDFKKNNVKSSFLIFLFFFLSAGSGSAFNILVV